MGFIKEVYSDNRAGLVVAFEQGNSENYFETDSVEAAMEYFNMYLKDNTLYIKTKEEQALNVIGVQNEDAVAVRSALDTMLSTIPDDAIESVAVLFPQWKENVSYVVGERVRYGANIYKVLQAHISQVDWTPDRATSLFAGLLTNEVSDEILEWMQPDSTNAYGIGDKVLFENRIYESVIDNNIWSPADYVAGWKEIIKD